MATKKCPVCGVSVKAENLVRHVKNQHPHEKVEGLETMAPARKRNYRDLNDDLVRVGTIVAAAGVVWAVLALIFPTPVGVMVPVLPGLLAFTLVGVGILAMGWVMGSTTLQRSGVKLTGVGVVVGLVLAGSSSFLATQQGVPILSTQTTQLPAGWLKAENPLWTISNRPVVFYYGSAACPYCAASSWALQAALQAFGSMTGATYTTSLASGEFYASVPEVELAHITYSSSYVSLSLLAGDNNQVLSAPSPNPVQNAYLLTYDSRGGSFSFPFYVVGGMYIHAGALVDPSAVGTVGLVNGQQVYTPMTPDPGAPALASPTPAAASRWGLG